MKHFIVRLVINAIGLYAAVTLIDGISMMSSAWTSLLWLALIFGFINALVRPILKFLTFPLILVTLGLFSLIINSFLFWLTSIIGQGFGVGLNIASPVFWNSLLGGLVLSVVGVVLNAIVKEDRKK
jgi:putative membrane protein